MELTAFLGVLEASDCERLDLALLHTRFNRHVSRVDATLKRARRRRVTLGTISSCIVMDDGRDSELKEKGTVPVTPL